METINDARICVNTQRRLTRKLPRGKWFPLSEFSDKNEFLAACYTYYIREQNPELCFTGWDHIPEGLVTSGTISENFFLLREAMEELDENEYNHFIRWCRERNYNLPDEDPYLLVSRYQEQIQFTGPEEDILPDGLMCNLPVIPNEDEENYYPSYYGVRRLCTRKSNSMYH